MMQVNFQPRPTPMQVNFQQRPTTVPYSWQKYTGRVPQNAVHSSENYVVIRAYYNNDWIVGKLNMKQNAAYIPYDYKEIHVTSNIEILTAAPGTVIEWVLSAYGQVPQGAVGPFGNDNVFVGRAVCPSPESVYTPGKIHPSHQSLYMPFDGKEVPVQSYEACVIRQSLNNTQWQKFIGRLPHQAVLASKEYAVIRAQHGGNWVPGKLSTRSLKAYIAYDMKEHEIRDFEILVQGSGAEARWIPASNGQVPQGAVGPFGNDGAYIGRAICPRPESVYTPGKVHPSHGCLYMPFDGKEENFKSYEVLAMVPTKIDWKSKIVQMLNGYNV